MEKARSWIVKVSYKPGFNDPLGRMVHSDIIDLGVKDVSDVRALPTYTLSGRLQEHDLQRICTELLADPVTQSFTYSSGGVFEHDADWVVEVYLKRGVTDAVGETTLKAVKLLGVTDVESATTGTTYLLRGQLDADSLTLISTKCLANPIIHNCRFYRGSSQ